MKPDGYTLLELLIVLGVLGALLGITFPRAGHWLDRAAVHSARDELGAALALTRISAVSHGGATLVLDPGSGQLSIIAGSARAGEMTDLARRYGVTVSAGTEDLVLFRYDALGIGRLTSRTVRFQRRSAEAGLTVSAYGRYRRW